MPHFTAIYRKKTGDHEHREEKFTTRGEDPDRAALAKKAQSDETFVGVFPNYKADAGLEDDNGRPVPFGPKEKK